MQVAFIYFLKNKVAFYILFLKSTSLYFILVVKKMGVEIPYTNNMMSRYFILQ